MSICILSIKYAQVQARSQYDFVSIREPLIDLENFPCQKVTKLTSIECYAIF